MKVVASGLDMTIQDLPGRTIGRGIPRGGPMDPVAFSVGNLLAGNDRNTEGIEIIVVPGVPARFKFFHSTLVAVTGKDVNVILNGQDVDMWSGLVVPAGGDLEIKAEVGGGKSGLRVYLAISGGFPNVPEYLGSKSTSMGLGGYQVREYHATRSEESYSLFRVGLL